MPKDDWAKARAKDKAKTRFDWKAKQKRKHKRRPSANPGNQWAWFGAIRRAENHSELSAVGRTLVVMHKAHKISDELYSKLVVAGKRRRQSLAP